MRFSLFSGIPEQPCLEGCFFLGGCGADCSSYTELVLSERMGLTGEDIMFTSNLVEMRHCGKPGRLRLRLIPKSPQLSWVIHCSSPMPRQQHAPQGIPETRLVESFQQRETDWSLLGSKPYRIQVPFPQKQHCTPRNHVSCPVFIPFILVTSTEEGQRAGSPGKPGRHLPHRLPGC